MKGLLAQIAELDHPQSPVDSTVHAELVDFLEEVFFSDGEARLPKYVIENRGWLRLNDDGNYEPYEPEEE